MGSLKRAFDAEAFFAQAVGYGDWDVYVSALNSPEGREEIRARIQAKVQEQTA